MFIVEVDTFFNSHGGQGRTRYIRTAEREERIMKEVEADSITGKIAFQEGIASVTAWEILHEELF